MLWLRTDEFPAKSPTEGSLGSAWPPRATRKRPGPERLNCWNHVAWELRPVCGGNVAGCREPRHLISARIVDVFAQIAKVGSGTGADTSSFEGGRYTVR